MSETQEGSQYKNHPLDDSIGSQMVQSGSDPVSDCKEGDCKEGDCKEGDCKEGDCKEEEGEYIPEFVIIKDKSSVSEGGKKVRVAVALVGDTPGDAGFDRIRSTDANDFAIKYARDVMDTRADATGEVGRPYILANGEQDVDDDGVTRKCNWWTLIELVDNS